MRRKSIKRIILSSLLLIAQLLPFTILAQNSAMVAENKQKMQDTKNVSMPLFLYLINNSVLNKNKIEQTKQELNELTEVKLQGELALKPFHKRNIMTLKEKMAVSDQSFCRSCHLPLPHQKNIRSRTFNNMHSRYIACETCHIDRKKLSRTLSNKDEQLEYEWFDYIQQTHTTNSDNLFLQNNGKFPGTTKITPFYKNHPAVIGRQHSYAKKIENDWKDMDLQQKAELKLAIHQFLKPEGEACQNCHSKTDSLLDMSALGATEQQQNLYKENSIVNFFKRYKDDETDSPQSQQQKEIQRIRISEILP